VSETGYIAAAAKIYDGFTQVNPSLYGAESFRHDCNLCERITNDDDCSLCYHFVLYGQKVMKPLQV
jgi:recombinational DNA repair protein RecR